jgi:hypothetical protein
MRHGPALVTLLVAIAVASPAAHGAHAAAGPRVTLFGDSVADALTYVPEAREFLARDLDLRLELSPCRKLVPEGCAYMGSRPPSVLSIVRGSTHSELGNIVIVAVGYNDPANNYETDMAQVANALVDRGVAYIVWVTVREKNDDYRTINEVIRSQAPRWPELQIADWEAASRDKDWFNADGLHLNVGGALGLATLLRPYVLSACGSPCEALGPAASDAPRNVRPPTLRGRPVVGQRLTCLPGRWERGKPLVFSFRWLRSARVLAGLHESSRLLGAADRGRAVACRVWAGNANGATQATSKAVRVRPRP